VQRENHDSTLNGMDMRKILVLIAAMVVDAPLFSQVVIRDSVRISAIQYGNIMQPSETMVNGIRGLRKGSISSKIISKVLEGTCRTYQWDYEVPLAVLDILPDDLGYGIIEGDPRLNEEDDYFIEGDNHYWTGVHCQISGQTVEFYLMNLGPEGEEIDWGSCDNPDYNPALPSPLYAWGNCPPPVWLEPLPFACGTWHDPDMNPYIDCVACYFPNVPVITDKGQDWSLCSFANPVISEVSPYNYYIEWPSRQVKIWAGSYIEAKITTSSDTIRQGAEVGIHIEFTNYGDWAVELPDSVRITAGFNASKPYGHLIGPGGADSTALELNAGYLKSHDLVFVADGIDPDSTDWIGFHVHGPSNLEPLNQNIQGYANSVVKKAEMTLRVTFEKDTVSYLDSTRIFVQLVDGTGVNADPSEGMIVRFQLDSAGQKYGTLCSGNGTAIQATDNISYNDAHQGLLYYKADRDTPGGYRTIYLDVLDSGNTISPGHVAAVVADSILFSIEIPGEKVIWPTFLPGGLFTGQNRNQNNIKENIIIRLLLNAKPLPNYSVTTSVSMRLPSGGHDHITPLPLIDSLGVFRVNGTNDDVPGRFTALTDTGGRIVFRYRGPPYGGIIDLRSSTSFSNDSLQASDSLRVTVADLHLIQNNTCFVLTGGTCMHHGPNDAQGSEEECMNPDHNHWTTNELQTAIVRIASSYDSANTGVRLRINDTSLEYGGLFDSHTEWVLVAGISHQEHRIGKQADIGHVAYVNNDLSDLNVIDQGYRQLIRRIHRYTNLRYFPHPDHFHIRVN
jgi:hypothetical protein